MRNLKNSTNELIYKTETDSQTTNSQSLKGKERGGMDLEHEINRCM